MFFHCALIWDTYPSIIFGQILAHINHQIPDFVVKPAFPAIDELKAQMTNRSRFAGLPQRIYTE